MLRKEAKLIRATLTLVIALSLIFSLLNFSYGKVKAFKASVKLEGLTTKTDALIIKNRTYLDLNSLERLLGFRVWWSYDDQLLYVGKVGVDVAPIIIGGKTYVPLRPVAKAAGYTISWDQRTRTVTLVKLAGKRYYPTTSGAKVKVLEEET